MFCLCIVLGATVAVAVAAAVVDSVVVGGSVAAVVVVHVIADCHCLRIFVCVCLTVYLLLLFCCCYLCCACRWCLLRRRGCLYRCSYRYRHAVVAIAGMAGVFAVAVADVDAIAVVGIGCTLPPLLRSHRQGDHPKGLVRFPTIGCINEADGVCACLG